MANVKIQSKISAEFTLTITESEARALAVLAGYSSIEILDAICKNITKTNLKPHEAGFISLFETLRGLDSQLSELDKAKCFVQANIK